VTQVLKDDSVFNHEFYPAVGGETLIHLNGEPHRRFRMLLSKVFAPRSIRYWEERAVPPVLDTLIAGLRGRSRAELVTDYAQPYPAMVFRSLMGLPEADTDKVRALAVLQIAAGVAPEAVPYTKQLGKYLYEQIAARRALAAEERSALPDLISLLVDAEAEGQRLDDDEIKATLQLLVTAGVDTTNQALANCLFMLLTRPAVLEEVKRDLSLVPALIEETLRLVPSGGNVEARRALRDVTVDGVAIPAGMPVITCELTANRDPEIWENPNQFDIHRELKPHLTFGTGPHVCIGMHLARMEIRKALERLLESFPAIRLDPTQPQPQVRGFLFQAPPALHVLL
jgi:cytochrome P450